MRAGRSRDAVLQHARAPAGQALRGLRAARPDRRQPPGRPRCERCWDKARSRGACAPSAAPPGACSGPTRAAAGPHRLCVGPAPHRLRCGGPPLRDRPVCPLRARRPPGRPAARVDPGSRQPDARRPPTPRQRRPARSMLGWLQRSPGAGVLADLAAGTVELSHQALDALVPADWVTHVRAVLVTAGALPPATSCWPASRSGWTACCRPSRSPRTAGCWRPSPAPTCWAS